MIDLLDLMLKWKNDLVDGLSEYCGLNGSVLGVRLALIVGGDDGKHWRLQLFRGCLYRSQNSC